MSSSCTHLVSLLKYLLLYVVILEYTCISGRVWILLVLYTCFYLFILTGSNVLMFLCDIRVLLLFIFMTYCDSE